MNTNPDNRPPQHGLEDTSNDEPERRGLTWAALVSLMVLTLLAALVVAYFITRNNFPAH